MSNEGTINWIESRGGPLILVPKSSLGLWRGVERTGHEPSDYERICEMTELVEVFSLGGAEALAFGDEPLPTTWLPTGTGGYVVQWVYADSRDAVAAYLRPLVFGEFPPPDLRCCVSGDCVLFDSADPGHEILGQSLEVSLRPGCYDISTKQVDPSGSIRLLIHALTWRTDVMDARE